MGFSVWAGGPVWERYSGLVLFGLEFALFGFFNFNLHFPQRPFSGAGYCSKRMKKAVLSKKENGWEKGAERSVPFLKKKKPEFLWLLRHKNPG